LTGFHHKNECSKKHYNQKLAFVAKKIEVLKFRQVAPLCMTNLTNLELTDVGVQHKTSLTTLKYGKKSWKLIGLGVI